MTTYYADNLSARRLERCYQVAPPRVQRYLGAEIEHTISQLGSEDDVLELGCGYGRVVEPIGRVARSVVGVDVAFASLALAASRLGGRERCHFACMDALALGFADATFDAVVCIQNGICAFDVAPLRLVAEALRVTRPGGFALFSTYSDRFWDDRLAWFERQAEEGLVGPIDRGATGDGVIACTDGFRSSRLTPAELEGLCAHAGARVAITEVDESSVFCRLTQAPAGGPGED